MGLLALKLLMSRQRRDNKHLRGHDRNRSIALVAKRKRSPCQHDNPQDCKRMEYSGPDLPEDIWYYIHSLLPMRDAARVACVSHAFFSSWRRHPNLTFSKKTLGQNDGTTMDLTVKVDRILEKHLGISVKIFKLEFYDDVGRCNISNWLRIAAKLRVENLTLILPANCTADHYDFPCSLLVDGFGNSIQYLQLSCCAFRPTTGLGHLRTLQLSQVHITGDELGCLLSNSSALKQLILKHCTDITYLKIPGLLQHLNYLMVFECRKLQMIESKAPNLSTFHYTGSQIQLSFGDPVQVKNMKIWCFVQCNTIYNARAKLPLVAPNLETLSISSIEEVMNTPIMPIKFVHLKNLSIYLNVGEGAFSPIYDYLSLVSYLDACPVLETFELFVSQTRMKHDSVLGDPSHLRQMPEYRHNNIKNVKIIGFCSAKGMVELTCHILENATSLECLMLDTINDDYNNVRHIHEFGGCSPISRHMIREAHKALLAVKMYIVGKVPPTVKLNVLEPCSICHALAA